MERASDENRNNTKEEKNRALLSNLEKTQEPKESYAQKLPGVLDARMKQSAKSM